jgi:hypothetical protein
VWQTNELLKLKMAIRKKTYDTNMKHIEAANFYKDRAAQANESTKPSEQCSTAIMFLEPLYC